MRKKNTNYVLQIKVYIKYWAGRLRRIVMSSSQATPHSYKMAYNLGDKGILYSE